MRKQSRPGLFITSDLKCVGQHAKQRSAMIRQARAGKAYTETKGTMLENRMTSGKKRKKPNSIKRFKIAVWQVHAGRISQKMGS